MSNLLHIAQTQIAKYPEVLALVVSDTQGTLLESIGNIDGEAVGAVHVVTVQALTRCGDALGIGALERVTISAAKSACVIVAREDEVMGAYVDPSKPLGATEKKIEAALRF